MFYIVNIYYLLMFYGKIITRLIMNYKYLFFDLDNTLYDFDASEKIALEHTLIENNVVFSENHLQTYKKINKACWTRFENGEISQGKLRYLRYELFLEALNLDADFVAFGDLYLRKLSESACLFPETTSVLEQLHGNFELVLISNGLKEVQRPKIRKSGIYDYFKTIVISDEIGVAKPHAGFFDYTFEQLNHPNKNEVLVIGDNLNSDIKGGINYDLDTCWLNLHKIDYEGVIKPKYIIENIMEILNVLNLDV